MHPCNCCCFFRFSSKKDLNIDLLSIEFGDREVLWQHNTASYPSAVEQEVQEHDVPVHPNPVILSAMSDGSHSLSLHCCK